MNIAVFILLFVSILFKLFPPKKINGFYGYRTSKSMENNENWKIANNYSANLMLTIFSLLVIINFILEHIGVNNEKINLGLILISFTIVIYFTEQKLKKNIKKNKSTSGNRA